MTEFIITKLERHPEAGYWTARVSAGGETIEVDKRYGSWHAIVRDEPGVRRFHRQFVLSPVAAALQERVRRLERKEREAAPEGQQVLEASP